MLRPLIPALAAVAFAACSQAVDPPQSFAPTLEMSVTQSANPLTIERLYASPSLNGPSPRAVKFSPDGTRVTFLKAREDDSSRYDLWQFDVATGAPSMLVDSTLLEPEDVDLSEEEKALRERQRIAGSKGIVSYDWGTSDTILVPIGGDLHLITLADSGPKTRQLTDTNAFEYDAKVSPDGSRVSFVRDGSVYAITLANGNQQRLTPLAEPDKAIRYGIAEFVAQEEMSRYTGYWWSPDGRYVAYTRVDESTVDIIPRFDIAAEDVTVIEQRYPRAGRPNAVVDLFIRDIESGRVIEIDWRREDWGPATDQYLARVNWARADGVVVQRVDRDQKTLEYVWFDPATGQSRQMHLEQQDTWINLSDDFDQLEDHVYTLTTEEQGTRQILVKPFNPAESAMGTIITDTMDFVEAIVGVDQDTRTVFFTGHGDTPLERHLYSQATTSGSSPVALIGADGAPSEQSRRTNATRITELGKSWTITMAPDGKSFVGISSGPDQPPQTGLYRADGSLIAWIEENALDERHPYAPYLSDHTVPEFGTLEAEDGQTLYYSIQKPPGFDASKQYPVLIEVYGGPHVQTVTRNWERLSDQFYSREGYIVFRLDNRGMANRGKRFENVIYRQTGTPEVRDQLVGVEWLKSQDFVDADRIAIQGWSYGGYMTLMILLQAPESTFAAAVSGAPVTDWTLYDTFYTERYMDTPQDNPDGYEKSSVFYHLERWDADLPPLLLVHGMADDNVTFDNTTRLMAELQQRRLPFDLMTYPGQRHGIRGEDLQVHLMKTRMAFLDRHLKGGVE
jgi:dipeptidyl-peptidase-4